MPLDPLEIVLKVVDDEAMARLRQYGEFARKTINDIGEDEKKSANSSASAVESAAKRKKKAAKDVGDETKEASKAALSLGQQWLALRASIQVGEMMKGVIRSIAEETRRARDFMAEWSDKLERGREQLIHLADLEGAKPTGQYAALKAQQAARAGVTPGQWKSFQETFYDVAGGAIIPPNRNQSMTREQMAAGGYTTNQSQATRFQQMAAGYAMNIKGLTGGQAARLAANVVQTAPAGATAEQMMDQYAKMVQMATRTPGTTDQMVEALGSVAQEYAERRDANGDWSRGLRMGAITAVEAERNPEQAVTSTRAFVRWTRQLRTSQEKEREKQGWTRMGELGITPDMDEFRQVEQVNKKLQEWRAAGKDENAFWDRYGGGYQFSYTALQTAGRRADVLNRVLSESQAASGSQAVAETGAAIADIHHPAHQRARESLTEAKGIAQATQDELLREREGRAIQFLIGTGQLRKTDTLVEAGRLQLRAGLGYGTPQEQLVRERVNEELAAELANNAKNPEVEKYLRSQGVRMPSDLVGRTGGGWKRVTPEEANRLFRGDVDRMLGPGTPGDKQSEIENLLHRIAESNERLVKAQEAQNAKAGAPVANQAVPVRLPWGGMANIPLPNGGARN